MYRRLHVHRVHGGIRRGFRPDDYPPDYASRESGRSASQTCISVDGQRIRIGTHSRIGLLYLVTTGHCYRDDPDSKYALVALGIFGTGLCGISHGVFAVHEEVLSFA